ncbi:MAG: glucose-6-phosphate isomerase, partial [Arenimonas sp.]
MSSKNKKDAWNAVYEHGKRLKDFHLRDVSQDHERARKTSLRLGPLHASFARQRLDDAALKSLFDLAQSASVAEAIRNLFAGAKVNQSENRAALHTSLRSNLVDSSEARAANELALSSHQKMAELIQQLEASNVCDIINVGIGGSDLGPRLAVDSLRDFHTGRFRVHFISNIDGSSAQHLLKSLDPKSTAAILVSKTFGTQETLINGRIIKDWLQDDSRLYAVSANNEKATDFGIPANHILPMWDWVGGRYSLWSCVGFSLALAIGMSKFSDILKGAAEMDSHFLNAGIEVNIPVRHALMGIW